MPPCSDVASCPAYALPPLRLLLSRRSASGGTGGTGPQPRAASPPAIPSLERPQSLPLPQPQPAAAVLPKVPSRWPSSAPHAAATTAQATPGSGIAAAVTATATSIPGMLAAAAAAMTTGWMSSAPTRPCRPATSLLGTLAAVASRATAAAAACRGFSATAAGASASASTASAAAAATTLGMAIATARPAAGVRGAAWSRAWAASPQAAVTGPGGAAVRAAGGVGVPRPGGRAGRAAAAAAAATAVGLPAAGVAAGAAVVLARGRPGAWMFGSQQIRTIWQDRSGYQHFQGRGAAWKLPSRNARLFAASAAAAGVVYYWWCLETVPYTGRRHSIMFVSPSLEQWMGATVFQQVTTAAQADGRLLADSDPAVRRVRRLGTAIARVASDDGGGGDCQHMQGLDWKFAVVDDPQPNAFVVPGGKVVVFTGLLRLLGHSDDELAAVMAHEVGHVLARHAAERMSLMNVWSLLNTVLFLAFGIRLPTGAMYMGLLLPYSRRAEEEADLIGLRLMARACFDPLGAPTMLEKLNRMEKSSGRGAAALPAFLRTHPLTEDRVKRVEAELAEAYRLYREAGCSRARVALGRAAAALNGLLAGPPP